MEAWGTIEVQLGDAPGVDEDEGEDEMVSIVQTLKKGRGQRERTTCIVTMMNVEQARQLINDLFAVLAERDRKRI